MSEEVIGKFTRDLNEALNELDVASSGEDSDEKEILPEPLQDSSSQLFNIIPKLNMIKTNIESNKEALLKEVTNDRSLHLLLYADIDKDNTFIPWWSTILYRINMAQNIIQKSHGDKNKYNDIGLELYEGDPSIVHVLAALQNPSYIVEELGKDTGVYKRAKDWFTNNDRIDPLFTDTTSVEQRYIDLCVQCFFAFFKAERIQGKVRDLQLVLNTDGSYGLIDNEYIYNINTEKRVLKRRESMVWFAKEVTNAYLFKLDWDNAIKWSRTVYNMLINVR